LRTGHAGQIFESMSVVECKFEAGLAAVDAIAEMIAVIDEPRWIVFEDCLAGRADLLLIRHD
jgi:hypothetical protein